MNISIRKETRALKWGWVVALALALLPLLPMPNGMTRGSAPLELWALFLFVGCLALGMESLGHEINHRTFALTLVQPVTRRRLWRDKMAALGLALGTVTLLFLVCSLWALSRFETQPRLAHWALVAPVVVLAGVGPCLYLSILVRQSAAVFWLSLLLPPALFGAGGMLFEKAGFGLDWMTPASALVAGVGVVTWWLAFHAFLRAEDLQPLGTELHLPWGGRRRRSGPRSATASLWWKEIRLHQLPAVITALMVALLGGLFVMRGLVSPELMSLWLAVWVAGWLLIPLMIGAGAVAEERRMGTLAVQRVLPASWRRQWLIKLGGAFGASLLLGALLPALLNWLAWLAFRGEVRDAVLVPIWFWVISWLAGTAIGLYGSSLARGFMQAFLAVAMVAGGSLLLFSLMVAFNQGDPRVLKLVWTITGGLGVPVLLALTWRNARSVTLDRRMVRNNVIAVVGLLIGSGMLSAGIFHRAWEAVTPWPAAGPTPPAVAGVEPGIDWGFSGIGKYAALTPDGRLWLGVLSWPGDPGAEPAAKQVGEDKTWVRFALGATRLYGLDTTRSLYEWALPHSWHPERGPSELPTRRIGAEGEWKAISARATHVVGLKKDGTLWGWGRSHEGQLAAFSDEDREEPTLMNTRTNWTLVSTSWSQTVAADAEGGVWGWGISRRHADLTKTEIGSVAPYPIAQGKDWVRISASSWMLAETADGSVWMFGSKEYNADGIPQYQPPVKLRYPLRGVAHAGPGYVAMTETGELWFLKSRGDFGNGIAHWLNGLAPVQLGSRTDWVGLIPYTLALTADGVVWTWQENERGFWLRPSRRPCPLITLGK